MPAGTRRSVGRLLAIALPIYFVWEMAQAPAFTGMPKAWWAATAMCALATLGDGVIVLALWGIGAMFLRDARWFVTPKWRRYALVVLVGVGLQVTVEWFMVYRLHRWAYGPAQPVVRVLGVGAADPAGRGAPTARVLVVCPMGATCCSIRPS